MKFCSLPSVITRLALIFLVVVSIGACLPADRKIPSNSLLDADEVDKFLIGTDVGPIVNIHFLGSSGDVLVLTSGDGTLRRIDGATHVTEREFNLGILSGEATKFNREGTLLLGARLSKTANVNNKEIQLYGDIGVWNTLTGERVACIDMVCFDGEPWEPSYLGASIDVGGKRVLRYSPWVYSVIEINNGNEAVTVQINDPDSEPRKILCEAVFDPLTDRIALAYNTGEVQIKAMIPYSIQASTETNISKLCNVDLAFSPDDRFLAQVINGQLYIWQLGALRGKLLFNESVEGVRQIKWSPSQPLLYVSFDNRIDIFSVQANGRVGYLDTPNITSFEVSPDSRSLYWGDTYGELHVISANG
jgi:WD40 repeat protein